jgi:hypothetical protein
MKFLAVCHTRGGGYPENKIEPWIPVFTGMTAKGLCGRPLYR